MEKPLQTALYHPTNLLHLFISPSKSFSHRDWSIIRLEPIFAICLYAAARTINNIEEILFRLDFGIPRSSDAAALTLLEDSWLPFWLIVFAGALVGGVIYWWVGGWWFKLRVRWSGAVDPDPQIARKVYAFSTLVFSLPMIIYSLWQMLVYDSYLQASNSDGGLISLTLIIVPFWVLFTAYFAARTTFEVSKWKALFWFVLLPGGAYLAGYFLLFLAMMLI